MRPATAFPVPHGRVLGDFVLGETLDEGGFGTVYRAEQIGLGRPAVVKVIRRSLTTRRAAVERFALEARLAARFDHPYAAHVYAFGVEPDGTMWIAMELVKGTSLDELLERSGPVPLERFVPLFERLCEVVQSAHDQGIVHRDIKPSNVMVLARAGQLFPKLLDFGIAKPIAAVDVAPADSAESVHRVSVTGSRLLAFDRTVDAAGPSGTFGSLTQPGDILGSPLYMAPEQWVHAEIAGPAADQYALALLAYEALTGSRAVDAPTLEALAHHHLHVPLPALPPEFSPAIHAVLARAADKLPERRFASLTALAAALRSAAGVDRCELDDHIPALSIELSTTWISDAPQPIAESVAALACARTPMRADERITAVASLLARWVGLLAIACRSRLGRAAEASRESELLIAMRQRSLLDREWLDLAVMLAGSHECRQAWPVPEMSAFVADDGAIARFRDMLRMGSAGALDDSLALQALEIRITKLSALLGDLEWLLDYTLAREHPDGLELWNGRRSDDRPRQRGTSDGSGALVLLDGYGRRIARLSPLFTVAESTPGGGEELFLFIGPGRLESGARFTSYPRGFERDDGEIWAWLAEYVLATEPQRIARQDDDASPYPGLAAYTASDHECFVGRERDVDELLNRLRSHAIVTVVGPSGIGKTSFLAAGLIPALRAGWHAALLRPGSDPIGALAGIVDRVDTPAYRDGTCEPATTAAGIAATLVAFVKQRGTHLVVLVDQAEELFTMCGDEAARSAFAEALVIAATQSSIHVVITIRDDFLCRADQLLPWRGRLGSSVQMLRVPSRADLERMIVVPALRHGYELDDPSLPAEIASAVDDHPGALPLVAFTMAKLWALRDRHFRHLTRASYEQIGGVAGAIVRHADGIVDRMPASHRRLVRLAFRRLLSTDGTRTLIGRSELVAALGGTSAVRTVVNRLLDARLLVSRDSDAGDRIEIIHETLATTWPRLAEWRRDDAAAAQLQQQLSAAARHWDERRRPADLLWRGAALADLLRLQSSSEGSLTTIEEAFSRASIAAAARARRHRVGAVAAAFVTLAAGASVLLLMNHQIAVQRTAAVERLSANFEDRGRGALADGDAPRAMLYLTEAARLGAHGPGIDVLASHAAQQLDAGLEVIGHGKAGIDAMPAGDWLLTINTDMELSSWGATGAQHLADEIRAAAVVGDTAVALSQRGEVVAIERTGRVRWRTARTTAEPGAFSGVAGSLARRFAISFDREIAIWDLESGQLRARVSSDVPISALTVDSTGAHFATGDLAGKVTVWDSATATAIATCEPHSDIVRALSFAPDGRTVVSGGNDGEVRICDAASGATVHRLLGHSRQVLTVAVSPDGQTVLSGGRDGKPRLWDARTGLLSAILEGHRGATWIGSFSPDGERVLTLGSDDGAARLWNREGMALGSLQGHGGRLTSGFWDRDGRHVITAGTDGAIRRWDTDRAIAVRQARAHSAPINELAVSANDRWALTASADGYAMLWDQLALQPKARLRCEGKMRSAAFAFDDSSALTVDGAGAARLWSIPDGGALATLGTAHVTTASYTRNANVVATAGERSITLWTTRGQELAEISTEYTADRLVIDPSGRWLFVRGATTSVLVIDLALRRPATHLTIRNNDVRAIAADASRVAITDGRTIRQWQLGTWQPTRELVGHRSTVEDLWFLADGRLVSTANDTVLVWGIDGHLQGRFADGERVFDVAASPDGAFIATSCNDGAIRIWDARTYRRLLVLPSHRLPVYNVRVTHDSAAVLSAGSDGMLVRRELDHQTRSLTALAEIVRCRVPLRLEGELALPHELDFADPTCDAQH